MISRTRDISVNVLNNLSGDKEEENMKLEKKEGRDR